MNVNQASLIQAAGITPVPDGADHDVALQAIDRRAALSPAVLRTAAGELPGFFVGVLGEAAAQLLARAVHERYDIAAPEGADDFGHAHRQQADEPVAVERADILFRAVAVPAGDHRVEWIYRPTFYLVGAAISMVGVSLLLIGAAWVGLSRRSRGKRLSA